MVRNMKRANYTNVYKPSHKVALNPAFIFKAKRGPHVADVICPASLLFIMVQRLTYYYN
jgi:hypothetical protein